MVELEDCMNRFDEPEYFDISDVYSAVYKRFLELDLSDRPAIRGQLEGPISFGFNVADENDRPILFDDTVRPFMLEFMARRVNIQLTRLKKKNPNAFMFVDEPGLQFLFSAMAGYGDQAARGDMETFFSMIERPRGVHLCGNPDWDFLLAQDLDILSLDVYSNGEVFAAYAPASKDSWIGAVFWYGELFLPILNLLRKKIWISLKTVWRPCGRRFPKKGLTGSSCFPEVCFPPPPVVW